MSYLTLAAGIPNFSKAVFSFWFRVPKESVIAAASHEPQTDDFLMYHILPLITFGRQQTLQQYQTPKHNVAVIHTYIPGEPDAGTTYDTTHYVEGQTYKVDPSFIGLSCHKDGTFSVDINLQMDGYIAFSASTFEITVMDIYSGSDPHAPTVSLGNGVVALGRNVGISTIRDVSHIDANQPEQFYVSSTKQYEPDRWHHLLLSFDVSGSVTIGTPFASSSCRLWYAIDDIDYRGAENMQPYRDLGGQWGPDTLDPNTILTFHAWRYSGLDPNWEAINYFANHYVGLPQGTYGGGSIPSEGAEMGIPASIDYVDNIFRVEMAELQIFTGVTLDTGVQNNRRAFVDSNGKPVDPTGTEDDPRGPGERLLGRPPAVLLHGNNNWQIGYNTGALGVEIDSDGELQKIPSGQFTPTAKIEKFKPEPVLEKTTA